MRDFSQIYGYKNVVNDKICFKNPINPTYIYLVITNRSKLWGNETGLSDFHKLSLTIMKVNCDMQKLKMIKQIKYENIYNEVFFNELQIFRQTLHVFRQMI